jgi:hypothetical protein
MNGINVDEVINGEEVMVGLSQQQRFQGLSVKVLAASTLLLGSRVEPRIL